MRRRLSLLLAGTLTLSLGVSARADDKISLTARAHFEAGVALLQDPDGARYEEAHREFLAAYEMSKSPRALGNIGLCAMKLERDAEAIDAYSRYLDEVPDIDPVEREQIRRDILTLRSGLARVSIDVSPENARIYDVRTPVRGQPIINVYSVQKNRISIGMRPGHHVIHARIGDRESPALEIDAQPGGVYERALTVAAPVVVRSGSSKTLPIMTLGLGLTALAAGGVVGYLALDRVDGISEKCPNGECPGDYDLEGAQRRARTLTTATDGLLIGGGAITLIGLTWLILSPSGSSSKEGTRASAACTGTGCFATIGGRF